MKVVAFVLSVMMVAGIGMFVGGEVMAQGKIVKVTDAGNQVCPVSGRKIEVVAGMEPATYEYKGKVYHLCCGGCISTFEAEPEKYSKIADQAVAESHKSMKDMPISAK
ncbi:MAG: YHS domain-containing protein [Candidatus Omnitrophota bacterium]